MRQAFLLAISALLLCSCNESVKYGAACANGDIPRCIDDYHYVKCVSGLNQTESCCSDAAIADGTCESICLMQPSGAVCATIEVEGDKPECGNGRVESGELCDGQDLNGNSCKNKYGMNAKGLAVCDPVTCTVRYDDCVADTTKCGDGIIDPGEDCDGDALDDHTCAGDVAGSTGTLKCTDKCRFDYSGCHLPSCGNGQIDAGESCDTTVPESLSCADFIYGANGDLSCSNLCQIDTSGCSIPKVGDRCYNSDSFNNGGCDENGRHFYCKNGFVHFEECIGVAETENSACTVLQLDDDHYKSACVKKRDVCDNPGEIQRRCAQINSYQTALNICAHDAVSGNNYWIETENPRYESCPYSCIWETGTCGLLSQLDTVSCERGDEPVCEGNVAVNCESMKNGAAYSAHACNDKCVVYDFGDQYYKMAACVFENEDKCEVGDPDIQVCYGDTLVTLECDKVLNETSGYRVTVDLEDCPNGCDPDTNQCFKLIDTEGTRCSSRSKSSCIDQDTLHYCDEDKRFASRACIGADGSRGLCLVDNDVASCYEPCSDDGALRSRCVTESDSLSYTITEICTNVDGKLVYKQTDYEECVRWGCTVDGTGCFKFLDTDGEDCSGDASECVGNIASSCKNGKKQSVDCTFYGDNYICATLSDAGGRCMETCNNVDEEKDVCLYDDEEGYVTVTQKCTKDENGELVIKTVALEPCSDGCNDTWDGCVSCTPGDIKTNCSNYSGEYGVTFYLECLQNGDSTYWTYMIHNGEYVYDLCPNWCNEEETACNKVIDIQGEVCDDTFAGRCVDEYSVVCSSSGHVSAEKCPENTSCHSSPATGFTSCTGTCTQPRSPYIFCYTFPEHGSYLYRASCERVDGGLYGFEEVLQKCPQDCNANGTACK